jgi:predicted nucleotide-binding protein
VEPVVLADQIGGGAVTLIEKLEEHLGENSSATFAVIVMTGDDIGRLNEDGEELKPRARQNVVLELGYAMGSLGRRRVAILHENGVELPSDIGGVAYYPLDSAGAWKTRLLGELKAAGIVVNAEALLS